MTKIYAALGFDLLYFDPDEIGNFEVQLGKL